MLKYNVTENLKYFFYLNKVLGERGAPAGAAR